MPHWPCNTSHSPPVSVYSAECVVLYSQYVALFMLNVSTLHNVVVSSTEVQQGCMSGGGVQKFYTVKACSLILLLDLD